LYFDNADTPKNQNRCWLICRKIFIWTFHFILIGTCWTSICIHPYEIAIMGDDFEKARKNSIKLFTNAIFLEKPKYFIITTRKIEVKRNYYFCLSMFASVPTPVSAVIKHWR
jgi:hypothetical protein